MEGTQKFQQKFILLVVVVVMMASGAFLLSPVAGIGQPSVSFANHTLMGASFTVPNLTFPQEDATHIRSGFDDCKCRATCFTLGSKCQAWSFIEGEGIDSECRIIDKGPETTNLINMTDATYFFKESSVGGHYTWAPDHLLYVELERLHNFQDAKEQCAKIPGHRMIIAHADDTLNFFIQYKSLYGYSIFWADLIKIGYQKARWADGTIVVPQLGRVDMSGTNENHFAAFDGLGIHDVPDDSHYRVLCQANPLGVEW
ncbi:uncharacterized protein [Macrobrachium rosenbergii]|uniref:uncharacterized protein n=1 Tax=Macrobrachium rosenbergii TaxID=79674 RepID=UPI0034D3A92E